MLGKGIFRWFFVVTEELAEMSIVELLFPELHRKCCHAERGCSHDDIGKACT